MQPSVSQGERRKLSKRRANALARKRNAHAKPRYGIGVIIMDFPTFAKSAVGAAIAVVVACSSSLPSPPKGAHDRHDFRDVATLPPAPRSEQITPRPAGDDIVWLDGEWQWRLGSWVWQKGGWASLPPGSTLAKWELRRQPEGTFRWAPSIVILPDGRRQDVGTLLEGAAGGPMVPPPCTSDSAPPIALSPRARHIGANFPADGARPW